MNLNQISHTSMGSNRMSVHSNSRLIDHEFDDPEGIKKQIQDIRYDVSRLSSKVYRNTREARIRGALFQDWNNLLNKVITLHDSISESDPITNEYRRAFANIKSDLQRIYDEDSTTDAEILPLEGSIDATFDWSPATVIPDLPESVEDQIWEIREEFTKLSNKINRPSGEARFRGTLFSDWKNLLTKIGELRVSIINDDAASRDDEVRQSFATIRNDMQNLYYQDISNHQELLPARTDSSHARRNWSPAARIPNLFPSFARRWRCGNRI